MEQNNFFQPLNASEENKEEDMNVADEDEQDMLKPDTQSLHKNVQMLKQSIPNTGPQTKKEKLRALFLRYAEVSLDSGISAIRSRRFVKLLQDAGLISTETGLTKIKSDIIYSEHTKGRKGYLCFDDFLDCLAQISGIVYPEIAAEKKSKALEQLIGEWLIPLQSKLPEECVLLTKKNAAANSVTPVTYDQNTKTLFDSVLPILKEIYEIYFGNILKAGNSSKEIGKIASKQLVAFMTSFNIANQFIQKETGILMLDALVRCPYEKLTNNPDMKTVFENQKQDIGSYFTFSRFLVWLFWVAVTGFDNNKGEYSPVGILRLIIYRESLLFIG